MSLRIWLSFKQLLLWCPSLNSFKSQSVSHMFFLKPLNSHEKVWLIGRKSWEIRLNFIIFIFHTFIFETIEKLSFLKPFKHKYRKIHYKQNTKREKMIWEGSLYAFLLFFNFHNRCLNEELAIFYCDGLMSGCWASTNTQSYQAENDSKGPLRALWISKKLLV